MVINMVLDSIIFMIKFWIEDRVFNQKRQTLTIKILVYLYNKTEYTHCVRFVIVNLIRLVLFCCFAVVVLLLQLETLYVVKL